MAQCLGVDSKKFKFSSKNDTYEDDQDKSIANPILKSETTKKLYDRTIATLKIICPHCDHSFDMPAIYHKEQRGTCKLRSDTCLSCGEMIPPQYIQNRVRLFLKQLQAMYYKGKFSFICRFNLDHDKLSTILSFILHTTSNIFLIYRQLHMR